VRSRVKLAVNRAIRRQVDALRVEQQRGLQAAVGKLQTAVGRVDTRVNAFESEFDDLRRDLDDLRRDVEIGDIRVTNAIADFAAARTALDGLTKLQHESAEAQSTTADRIRDLSALVNTFRTSLELLLGPTGRHLTRLITEPEVRLLISEFDFIGDRDHVVVAVHQAYRTLLELEGRGVGRFAGSTSNIVAKMAAIAMLPPPSAEVLEVGTLFGVGAVGVTRQLARIGIDAHLTIVDPFAGYQVQPERGDEVDVSYSPATRTVVERNLALGGVATDRYRLIQGRSDSPETQHDAADRSYGLVIIDGDHSEAVAYNDLTWVGTVCEPGAVVVLDDCGDPAWPGVADALDRYLNSQDTRLELIGRAATSAFLRAR
jgi:predicted O-methyltransferase YrrM